MSNPFQAIPEKKAKAMPKWARWTLSAIVLLIVIAIAGCAYTMWGENDEPVVRTPVVTAETRNKLAATNTPNIQLTVEAGVEATMEAQDVEEVADNRRTESTNVQVTTASGGGEQPAATNTAVPANTPKPVTSTPVPQGNKGEETYAAGGGSSNYQESIRNAPDSYFTEDGVERVRKAQTYSYAPQEGYVEPGFGTPEDEVGIVVGYHLSIYTRNGLQHFDDGCQQFVFPPSVNAVNMGGTDWGVISYEWNPQVTEWKNELLVLSWEAAKDQIYWENCPDLPDDELLAHIYVIEQDGKVVKATPWLEYERETGDNHTLMYGPGEKVWGWHLGFGNAYTGVKGQNGQDNVCVDGQNCFLPKAPSWGWVGGGVINGGPNKPPADVPAIPQQRIDQVLATLPE